MKKIYFIILVFLSVSLWSDLNFGKGLFNDGLYEEAINEFEKVIAYSPTSDDAKEAIFLIGASYRARGQFIKAESAYDRLLEGFPGLLFRDKVLYYLAQSQFDQQKYNKTAENLKLLIDTYPNSNFSKMSLSRYLECLFKMNRYDDVIIKGRKIVQNYKDYHNIPDVLLWLAQARLEMQMTVEGKSILNEIITEYPDHISRWKAVEKQIEITEREEGIEKAAEMLIAKLQEDIPRNYEEILRFKLADYYIYLQDYQKAYFELSNLINKFSSSLQLDEYILKFTSTQLELKKFNEVKNDYSKYKKVFRESVNKDAYLMQIAQADFLMKNLNSSNEWLSKITTNDGEIKYRKQLLNANILLASGKYANAAKEYEKLLNNKYASRDQLLLKLGDVYSNKFHQYIMAKKYYQWILTEYSPNDLRDVAIYKIALCFENLAEFENAVKELEQIDIQKISDSDFQGKIKSKLEYLKKFKKRDYETAFNKLLDSFYNYLENDDKQNFQKKIVTILTEDLKEFEKGLSLVDNDLELKPLKAKIMLQIAKKLKYENNKENADNYIANANSIISELPNSNIKTELLIFSDIILSDEISIEQVNRIKDFVKSDNTSSMRNEFILVILRYYSNDPDYAIEYFEMLQLDNNIDERVFVNYKMKLAEYYYNMEQYGKALPVYELIHSKINLSTPYKLVEYAVVLNETGNQEASIEKFTLLLNNVEDIHGIGSIVFYFTKLLRSLNKFDDAIKYEQLFPSENRNDIYYNRLANDYLKIGNKEKAKETLMHIIEKSEDDLAKLAYLQFTTNDFEMAKYTYGELAKQNSVELKYYEMLGRINFIQENYLESAVNYKKVIDTLEDNFSSYDNINEIAKENIIALYRIENRPKAETLAKKFKNQLTDKDKNEIEISRGIYYKKIDKKKAESIFTKLLNKKNLTTDVIIKAYFWRGIVRLEKEELDEAEADFSTVANSIDINMSNQAHLKLGTINFSKENYQKALSHYYKVIQNDEDGKLAFDAASNFAFVCKTIKEWQKAIAAYQIILERWGDEGLEAKTVFDIAFCHFRDKKYSHAIEMFTRAIPLLEDKETQVEAQYWIGESYFGMENYEDAVSELLKVGYNYPQFTQWAASAELKAGEAYQNSNQFDKATQIYERIISKYGKYSQWGTEASNRLLTLE